MQFTVGEVVEGKVSGITKFGAFIKLADGKVGLVHISEVANEHVSDIRKYLKENQKVKAKIISINDDGKINLSVKKLLNSPSEKKTIIPDEIDWEKPQEDNACFEDRLAKFMKDSDEKQNELKKSFENKRGSGGYRRTGY